jgi:hypothetical protein
MCEVKLEGDGELDLDFDAATATTIIVVKITIVHTIHSQKVLSADDILKYIFNIYIFLTKT